MVDRSSPLPLWAQVAEDLRRRLDDGEFDERFPGDHEIADRYDVSRHTAREAIRRLTDEGRIVRERGRGTRVVTSGLEQPLGTLYSLYRSVEDQGFEQHSTVLALDEREAPAVAARLDLADDAPLVYLERVRFADDDPIAVDRSWLPAEIARPLLGGSFERTALYAELAQRTGQRPCSGWERLSPALPDRRHADLLGITTDDPVFRIERLTRGLDSTVIEWRESVVRGDRFSFVARWDDRCDQASTGLEPTSG